jgi:hypothetical protein
MKHAALRIKMNSGDDSMCAASAIRAISLHWIRQSTSDAVAKILMLASGVEQSQSIAVDRFSIREGRHVRAAEDRCTLAMEHHLCPSPKRL